MSKLSELASAHMRLSFPEFPEDDDFADWMSELVEVDAYYFGHAETLIAGGTPSGVSDKELHDLTSKFELFAGIKGEDGAIYLDCKRYMASLRALVDEMLRSL